MPQLFIEGTPSIKLWVVDNHNERAIFYGLMFLFGTLISTIVNLKKRPTITNGVSYDVGSCPLNYQLFVL